jgi:hypothetical protein
MYKNNTSATVEGLANSDSSGPFPTSVCVPRDISPLGYKELLEINSSSEVIVHPKDILHIGKDCFLIDV